MKRTLSLLMAVLMLTAVVLTGCSSGGTTSGAASSSDASSASSEAESESSAAEENDLLAQIKEKGYTLVPLQVYFKGSLVKVEIGLARGKKLYDKRQDIAKKDQRREAERDFKVKNLY